MVTIYLITLVLNVLYSIYFSSLDKYKDKMLSKLLILSLLPVLNILVLIIYSISLITILSAKP
jgi:hypothetical protein